MINSDLPEESGIAVLQKIRKSPVLQDLPVIMISDHDSMHEKITAFEEGADDYLIRPFDTIELIVRIKALLRRVRRNEDEKSIRIGDLKIYPEWHKVLINDEPINLRSRTESRICLPALYPCT